MAGQVRTMKDRMKKIDFSPNNDVEEYYETRKGGEQRLANVE